MSTRSVAPAHGPAVRIGAGVVGMLVALLVLGGEPLVVATAYPEPATAAQPTSARNPAPLSVAEAHSARVAGVATPAPRAGTTHDPTAGTTGTTGTTRSPGPRDGSTDAPDRARDRYPVQLMTGGLSDRTTIVGVATDAGGAPIPAVGFTVESQLPDGRWQGPEQGPLVSDDQGRFEWSTRLGTTYRFCFLDDYYGAESAARTTRYATACWRGGSTIATATDIPVTAATARQQTFTVRLTAAGRSLRPTAAFVHGRAAVGSTLRADAGRWQPAGVGLAYTWTYADPATGGATPIPGATGPAYTPTAADAGRSLSVVVTGTAQGYKPAPLVAYAGTVGQPVPATSAPLTISGSGAAGQVLSADHGTQTPVDGGRTLTWLVDGVVAKTSDDEDATFVPTSADVGKRVTLRYLGYAYAEGLGEVHDYAVGPTITGP